MSVKKRLSPAKRPTQLGDDRESDLMFAKELKAPLRRGKHKPVTKVRLIIERAIDQATIGNFHAMENLVRVWPVLKDVITTRSATRANNSTVDYARMSLQEARRVMTKLFASPNLAASTRRGQTQISTSCSRTNCGRLSRRGQGRR